jgi:hypothetical protein
MGASGHKCKLCGFPFSEEGIPLAAQDHMSDKHGIEFGGLEHVEEIEG